ncbi:MAG: SLBB domain-containing protein [Pseudomonadota bacterium]
MDLFAYFILGRMEENPYLKDGDEIIVPLRGPMVRIEGPVKRPQTYELSENRSLAHLVELAGGTTPGLAKNRNYQVIRHEKGEKKILDLSPDPDQLRSFQLEEGDIILIPHLLMTRNHLGNEVVNIPGDNMQYPSSEGRVFVIGAVTKPGTYPFNPYYNYQQYITLAGGQTRMAVADSAKVVEPSGHTQYAKPSTIINPGDSVVVKEKAFPPEFWVSWMTTLASVALSAYAILHQ